MLKSMLFFSCDFSTTPTQLQPPQVFHLFFSNLEPPTPNFCLFNPLRTLLHYSNSQPFSFQSLPHSLPKTTRGGGTPAPLYEEKMKPQTVTHVVLSARCTHRTDTGRRCRLSVSDAHSSLCRQHRAEQTQEQAADHRLQLIRNFQGFQTAQGINHSLKHLYELLAQNRISPRRASVLAYINSLLLRTCPKSTPTTPPESSIPPNPSP